MLRRSKAERHKRFDRFPHDERPSRCANEGPMTMSEAGTLGKAGYGINTYSFIHKLSARNCLEHLADRGYRKFEIMLVPGHFWPSLDGNAERRAIAALLARQSLQVLTLNQPNLDINLSSVVPEMRKHSCAVIAAAVELAAEWNAQGVVVNPGKSNPVFPESATTLADCFRRSLDVLVPIARHSLVELIVKNHPLSYLYRAEDLRAFFDRYGWDQVGLGYDFANGCFGREEADAVLGIRNHVRFLYAADTPLDNFRHAQIGTGTVAFDRIAAMLHAAELCRPTILEIVADDPESAISSSIAHLESMHWPAG
jgi:sugar phosphate isomerase/epimerase